MKVGAVKRNNERAFSGLRKNLEALVGRDRDQLRYVELVNTRHTKERMLIARDSRIHALMGAERSESFDRRHCSKNEVVAAGQHLRRHAIEHDHIVTRCRACRCKRIELVHTDRHEALSGKSFKQSAHQKSFTAHMQQRKTLGWWNDNQR